VAAVSQPPSGDASPVESASKRKIESFTTNGVHIPSTTPKSSFEINSSESSSLTSIYSPVDAPTKNNSNPVEKN